MTEKKKALLREAKNLDKKNFVVKNAQAILARLNMAKNGSLIGVLDGA